MTENNDLTIEQLRSAASVMLKMAMVLELVESQMPWWKRLFIRYEHKELRSLVLKFELMASKMQEAGLKTAKDFYEEKGEPAIT